MHSYSKRPRFKNVSSEISHEFHSHIIFDISVIVIILSRKFDFDTGFQNWPYLYIFIHHSFDIGFRVYYHPAPLGYTFSCVGSHFLYSPVYGCIHE